MRDLLTDLVRRTRRPESTVQPRLPSAFEASPRAMRDLVVDEDIVAGGPAPVPPPPSTREYAQPPAATRAREPHHSPVSDVPPRQRTPTAPTDTVEHDSQGRRTATPAPSNVVARTMAQVTPATAPGRVPAEVAAAQPASPRLPSVSIAPHEARAPFVAAIQPTTRAEPPTARGVRAEPPRDGPADARDQPAPEIRISIGRIEVRATAAGRPPERRHPSSAPPLTLDEYLAARARRGTR